MKVITVRGKLLKQLCDSSRVACKSHVQEKVRCIIEDVKEHGDQAITKYTKRFDKASLKSCEFRVPESEISGAYQGITSDFIANLKLIINNVTMFYKKQIQKPCRVRNGEGILLKENIVPLDTVGVYIPAGTAPLISTVYMTVVPALVAGVKRIIICTPPNKLGHVNSHILAVANLLKVKEIYKVGGAQGIAAMALGTRNIPKVDKIVGPGNIYVTEAKRQLFGYVGIDMLAGPSELVIIANRLSNIDYIVADLEAQMEHLGGLGILITTSKRVLKNVKKRLMKGKNAYGLYVNNLDEAVSVANAIAPEHLQILTNNAASVAKNVYHAGAIFLGPYSPTALGDYVAGPSHVLPTMGTARYFSGLSLSDFYKKVSIISYSKRALEKVRPVIEKVAKLEGLKKHYESINVRFE